jgi:autotransporter family porin
MVDGASNDVFRIANTLGGKNLTFTGSHHSTLAVDATLKGPGSTADHLIIDGSTYGRTELQVVNLHSSSARYTPIPVPVIFVQGKNVDKNNFYLPQPVDAGFFDCDLFFRPTGSGIFELKNHPGGGAHVLPELVTLTHDVFHNSTETWFDQSTDLRVMLAQGATCSDPNHPQTDMRCQELYRFTPGVWARGSGNWFNQQDSGVTHAHGRTYNYDLGRDLSVGLFESGIDFGKRDLFAQGDILVVGILGGAVESSLDYTALDRGFNLGGGEAGAYATYLNGGWFVDTLFKGFFGKVDPDQVRGFPDTLDNTTYGIRTDTGYRFGGMRYGPFIEPLATIAASWSQVEDFVLDGNVVNLGDDDDVRGRLGLRLGTSSNIWNGTTFEPFVVGSLWGTLSDAHHASLVSNGRRYDFYDTPEDVWGVVSGGVNFFNPARPRCSQRWNTPSPNRRRASASRPACATTGSRKASVALHQGVADLL